MTPSRRQSRRANWALGLSVFAGAWLLLEAGARFWETRHPLPRVATYIWNWERMWSSDFYTVGSGSAGWPPGEEWNADGLRDRAHPVEKPARTLRVVVLGDSVTMGHGIEAHQAYPQVLQRRLDAQGRRIEVFNVALQGWSTRQERIAYGTLARRYAPDLVVLAVCLNDVAELQNNLGQPPAWLLRLHRRSALVRLLVNASGREIHAVEELFSAPDSRRVRSGYERLYAEVRSLRDAVHADGGRLALLVFPFRFQVLPGAPPPLAQETLTRFARANAIPVLDLLPSLAPRGAGMFVDYDHLSPEGAVVVADELAASGLLPQEDGRGQVLERLLAGHEARDAQPVLIAALDAPDPGLREVAAWDLARHGPRAAARLTRVLQEDPDRGVRTEAARSLGALAGASARTALQRALADPSENVRWAAAEALAAVPPDAVADLDALVAALRSSDPHVRAFAAWALARLGPASAPALPALLTALRDETRNRGLVAQAIASLGARAQEALPALIEMLASSEAQRRANGAHTLGRLGTVATPAVGRLAQALHDPDARVRTEAARALGRVGGGGETVDALVRALADPDEQVRLVAARALGWLGPAARAAAPALARAQEDESERVAGEAERALEKVR